MYTVGPLHRLSPSPILLLQSLLLLRDAGSLSQQVFLSPEINSSLALPTLWASCLWTSFARTPFQPCMTYDCLVPGKNLVFKKKKTCQVAGDGETHWLNTYGNKYEDVSSDLQIPVNAGWAGWWPACNSSLRRCRWALESELASKASHIYEF